MSICAIHQPNFFPWIGYFDKIRIADTFVFLDQVAYPKSGSGSGSWCNRVKLLQNKIPSWYGLSIKKTSGVQPIDTVEFSNKDFEINKIFKSLESNYKKKEHFDDVMNFLYPILCYSTNNLAEFNIYAITQTALKLGLKTKFIRQSQLEHSQHSNALLIELLQQVKAEVYLCGNGASGYQEDGLFHRAGIQIQYQDVLPGRNFIPDLPVETAQLSIVHLLFDYYSELIKTEASITI